MTEVTPLDLYGKDLTHAKLSEGYETHEAYAGQGDTRVVKALLMPVHVRVHNPMFPGQETIKERLLRRGDKVTAEELGLLSLEKGERLHAFYTDAELKAGGVALAPTEPVKVSSEELESTEPALNELGAHELVDWLSGNGGTAPSVAAVLEAVGSDADFAKRVIEAEKTRAPDDARTTLVGPLTKIAEATA